MQHDNIDFLKDHSLKYIEMALSTDHIEKVTHPDGYWTRTRGCKNTVEIFLTSVNNILKSVSFWVQGCMNTVACCNALVKLCEGKTIEEAWCISPEKITDFLETLPRDHFHCAELAVGALYLALADLKQHC